MPTARKVAFLTTHPVHYQATLLRRLAREPDIDLTVFYASDFTLRRHVDPGFAREVDWDVPLLDGYKSEFLPRWGRNDEISQLTPITYGLDRRLQAGGFDSLIIHAYSRPLHWMAAAVAKARGRRVLIRDESTGISKQRGRAKRTAKQLFFRSLDLVADGWLAIGRLNADYYRAQGIADAKIFMTPYAVDNLFFQRGGEDGRRRWRNQLDIPDAAPVVLYASKLQRRKHADHLLEAFARLPAMSVDPHLVIVGDGELMPVLRARGRELRNIHFLGFRGQRELVDLYAMCDVFVLPSSFETWGLVVNEAMNLGKAIIVSDQVGSGHDLVRSGDNGFVFPVGNIGALSDALERLCRDPALAAAMGRRSLEIISAWDYEADVAGFRQALGLPNPARPGRPA